MSKHNHTTDIPYSQNKRALILVLCITSIIMLVELAGGLWSGSLALISDAGHMLTDTGSLAFTLLALWYSRRPATSKKSYGFYRFEILSALLNGVLLALIAGYIFFEAYKRLLNPQPIAGGLMLEIAIIGLLANLIGVFILSKGSHENLNIKGAFWHILSDALSSVGVIIGGMIILLTGFTLVDPIIGFAIAILILRGALNLVFESVDILLESTPGDIDVNKVIETVKKIKGVKDFHDLHIWTITSGLRSLSAHVYIEDTLLSKCEKVSAQIKQLLKDQFNITHTTLEFECVSCEPNKSCLTE